MKFLLVTLLASAVSAAVVNNNGAGASGRAIRARAGRPAVKLETTEQVMSIQCAKPIPWCGSAWDCGCGDNGVCYEAWGGYICDCADYCR